MHESRPATPEERARAVAYWETVVRPELVARREPRKPTETPVQVLMRVSGLSQDEVEARLLPDA